MSFLRKQVGQDASGGQGSFVDADFQKGYPALTEYLTVPQYPDGSPRALATLTLFREDGLWKACLNEKDQGLVLFVAEGRFNVLLEALELLLQEEHPPWRKSTAKRTFKQGKGGTGA
jgi:hypothetical protein